MNQENDDLEYKKLIETRPHHSTIVLLKFLDKRMRRFWKKIGKNLSEQPEYIKELAEKLPEVFAAIDKDNDRHEKKKVYLIIANFLKEKIWKQQQISEALPTCLHTVHLICDESDVEILADGSSEGEQLLEVAKKMLLTIKVHYQRENRSIFKRLVEIYYMEEDVVTAKKILDRLDWDYLTEDVKAKFIREPISTITFKLFPKEM